jgi:hypothetical protein
MHTAAMLDRIRGIHAQYACVQGSWAASMQPGWCGGHEHAHAPNLTLLTKSAAMLLGVACRLVEHIRYNISVKAA